MTVFQFSNHNSFISGQKKGRIPLLPVARLKHEVQTISNIACFSFFSPPFSGCLVDLLIGGRRGGSVFSASSTKEEIFCTGSMAKKRGRGQLCDWPFMTGLPLAAVHAAQHHSWPP